jgi:hypothetical protein
MADQFHPCSRREFLKAAVLAAPVLADGRLAAATGAVPGVNELRVGIIGLGPRGNFLRERFQKLCRVTSLCDVHQTRLSGAVAQSSGAARPYGDYRELLSSPNVDGVVIATPDHWHARMSLDALRAGKHVFCETPASRTLAEVIALQKAAKASNLKIQVGTQGRANSAAFAACRYLREGQLGTLRTVRLWSAPDKALNQPSAASPPPAELDWRLWLGPLKERPFDETLFLGDWRFVDEIGGGRLVSHGAQLLALLQWFFGREFDGQVEVEPTSGPTRSPRTGSAQELRLAFGFKQPNLRCLWEIGPGDGKKPD